MNLCSILVLECSFFNLGACDPRFVQLNHHLSQEHHHPLHGAVASPGSRENPHNGVGHEQALPAVAIISMRGKTQTAALVGAASVAAAAAVAAVSAAKSETALSGLLFFRHICLVVHLKCIFHFYPKARKRGKSSLRVVLFSCFYSRGFHSQSRPLPYPGLPAPLPPPLPPPPTSSAPFCPLHSVCPAYLFFFPSCSRMPHNFLVGFISNGNPAKTGGSSNSKSRSRGGQGRSFESPLLSAAPSGTVTSAGIRSACARERAATPRRRGEASASAATRLRGG